MKKLFFIIVLIVCSCSSKKKTTEVNKEEIKIENFQNSEKSENTETNVKVDIVTKMDDKSKTVSVKKTYLPVDASKPASVTDPDGKKHDLNNASLIEETTTELKDKKTENSDNSQKFQKKESAGKVETKGSATAKNEVVKRTLDKSGFTFWSWFWMIGIVIIGIILVYLNYRFKWFKRVTTFFSK